MSENKRIEFVSRAKTTTDPILFRLRQPREGVTRKGSPDAWNAWCTELVEYLEHPICGAPSRSNEGVPCINWPVSGRDVCRMHGGKSLRGPANPNWKTGRTSVFRNIIPEKLQGEYDTMLTDPKILAMEADIAVLDIRIAELMRNAFSGKNPIQMVEEAARLIPVMRTALEEPDLLKCEEVLGAFEETLKKAKNTDAVWDKITTMQERRRKLVDTEGRRLERMQEYITADEARAYNSMVLGVIVGAAEKVLPDDLRRKMVAAVYEGISSITQKREIDPAQLPAHIQAREQEINEEEYEEEEEG